MEDDLLLSSPTAGVPASITALSSLDWCLAEVNIPCEVPVYPPSSKPKCGSIPASSPQKDAVPQRELQEWGPPEWAETTPLSISYCRKQEHDNMREIFFLLFLCKYICHPSLPCQDSVFNHKQEVVKGLLPGSSSWLIITDNLNQVNENDENLEVEYSIGKMCPDRKAKPKNGL